MPCNGVWEPTRADAMQRRTSALTGAHAEPMPCKGVWAQARRAMLDFTRAYRSPCNVKQGRPVLNVENRTSS
jgi:hypothetical protein